MDQNIIVKAKAIDLPCALRARVNDVMYASRLGIRTYCLCVKELSVESRATVYMQSLLVCIILYSKLKLV